MYVLLVNVIVHVCHGRGQLNVCAKTDLNLESTTTPPPFPKKIFWVAELILICTLEETLCLLSGFLFFLFFINELLHFGLLLN